MNADVLTTGVADCIAVITLGSAKQIYFNAEMGDMLTTELEKFAGDPSIPVVVVTGGAGLFQSTFQYPGAVGIGRSRTRFGSTVG